jgi:hypothetical protein
MNCPGLRSALLLLACAIALGQAACSVEQPLVLTSSTGAIDPDARHELGRVEVEVDPSPPEIRLEGVHRGVLEGLGIGALRGVTMLVVFPIVGAAYGTAVPPPPIGTIAGGFVGGAVGVGYFPLSLLSGMGTAVPPGDCDAAVEEIRKAVIEAAWRERLNEALSRELPAREAPSSSTSAAVVRVSLRKAGTTGSWLACHNLWSVDHVVALFVEGEARLVRRSDGLVLGKLSFRLCSTSERRQVLEWSKDEGAAARSYLAYAADRAAGAIIAEWFPAPEK